MVYDWQQLAAVFGVIGGLTVAVGVGIRLCKKLLHKVKDDMFGIGELQTNIEALSEQVAFVVTELQPNKGASIRDCLNRIELRQVLQEQRQWAILADMSVGVFEADPQGEIIKVNRKYLRMTGRTLAEIIGNGWINTVAHRDRARVEQEWSMAISEEREFESEYKLITPEDERLAVSVRTYKMVDERTGVSLGFLGMLTPLDEEPICQLK